MAEEGGRVPMSPGLQATLLRARDYAASQSQPQVVLEHLLLALTEDADAAHVLEASQIDIGRLRNDVAGFIGAMQERAAPGTPGSPAISPALTQVLKYATLAAQQGRRASIDGAIVLAALIGDGRSMAASFLKAQGLTFEAAIKALRDATARLPAPQPVAMAQHATPHHPAPPPERPTASPAAPSSQGLAAVYEGASTTPRAEDMLAAARERIVSRTAQTGRTQPPREPQPAAAAPAAEPPAPVASAVPAATATPIAAPAPVPDFDRPTGPPPSAATKATSAFMRPPEPTPASLPKVDPQRSTVAPQTMPGPSAAPSPGAAQPPMPQRLQLPPPSAWAPPPSAPQSPSPGMQAYRQAAPVPPAGWNGRPPGQAAQTLHAPARGPQPERPGTADAPWSEPLPSPSRNQRQTPVGPPHQQQRPVMMPPAPAPGAGTSGALVAPSRGPAIDPSQITHSITPKLTLGRPQPIEVRIERPPLAGGGGGQRPHALRAETVVARAIAVKLRPLSGRFVLDAASPETQWDQGGGGGGAGRLASEAAVWRFTVTPLASGRGVLQLAVSARTIGADGVLAETQLPDQVFEVRAAPDVRSTLVRVGQFALVGTACVLLFKLAETLLRFDIFAVVRRLLA